MMRSEAQSWEELLNGKIHSLNTTARDDMVNCFCLRYMNRRMRKPLWLLHHLPFHIPSVQLLISLLECTQTFWSKAKVSDSCLYKYISVKKKRAEKQCVVHLLLSLSKCWKAVMRYSEKWWLYRSDKTVYMIWEN